MTLLRELFYSTLIFASLVGHSAVLAQDSPASKEADFEQRVETLRRQIAKILAEAPENQRDDILRTLITPIAAPHESETEKTSPKEARVETQVGARSTPKPPAASEAKPKPLSTGVTPTLHAKSRKKLCNTLDFLDENGDGKISAGDRNWRYLYLWIDRNRDGSRQDKELISAYEAKIREIALDLETFTRKKGSLGEIRNAKHLLFDLDGNGFGDQRRIDDGLFLVDTSALARSNGPQILGSDGKPLSGIQPWGEGWIVRLSDGTEVALNCP